MKIETNELRTKIVPVGTLLKMKELLIPVYQRPYKWKESHALQLMDDVSFFQSKSSYRLGTIVIHNDNGILNIVDGQQRTITCLLIFKAIASNIGLIKNPILKKEIEEIKNNLIDFKFNNRITFLNIRENYKAIQRNLAKQEESFISYFIQRCEFIFFEIDSISEAFQFFDAQNSRGKDLDPHDLLKAYHLREYNTNDEFHKNKDVEAWEDYQSDDLAKLFSEYLYRIKGWSRGQSSRAFTKNEIYLFKGINVEKIGQYNYADPLRILHHFIDDYNNSYHRNIDLQKKDFPFQLDAPILNGRRFFEMIGHYKIIFEKTILNIQKNSSINDLSKTIFKNINSYHGCKRTGDVYVRTLFECALVYYVDKFGFNDINFAIEKLFAWAYKLRLQYYAIQFVSVDNYVLSENIFQDIKNNYTPREALNRKIEYNINLQREIPELVNILKDLYYL